ncbi:MAG TPA: trypsin-like peptidase domain-containing protein [Acidimicrobiales bacterium]|nr:trypsin-like peptidase domain-containing protein [Acidimicrobiales bacterium]
MDDEAERQGERPGPPPPPPRLFDGEALAPSAAPRRRFLAVLLAVALLAGGIGAALGASVIRPQAAAHPTRPRTAARPSLRTLAATVAAVEPSVVDIRSALSEGGAAAGTGIVLDGDGLVLTNNHVVLDAASLTVTTGGSASYPAHVIGVDPAKDIALVQIDGLHRPLAPAHLGDSSGLRVGTAVVALGNVLGRGGVPTPATGVVTAKGRSISASDDLSSKPEKLTGLLETTVDIQEGDSGGPLVDLRGRVVGMDTAMATADGGDAVIGFAIPINEARAIARLITRGRAGDGIVLGTSSFLGVEFPPSGTLLASAPKVPGAPIEGVVTDGPAAKGGLEEGDVITALGGRPVTSPDALQQLLLAYRPGMAVGIGYVDRSGRHTVTVTLGSTVK